MDFRFRSWVPTLLVPSELYELVRYFSLSFFETEVIVLTCLLVEKVRERFST